MRRPTRSLCSLITLGILLVLSRARVRRCRSSLRPRAAAARRSASLAFFAAIGLGFLLLEIVLIQRFVLFLGFPTYALSVVLFALLVFTGLGSLLSDARGRDPRRALMGALSAACALIAASAFGLQPLLRALIDLPFALRVAPDGR